MVGIYCITNLVNNKKYIGQSSEIERRWKEHIKEANKGSNKSILYQAIRKYGLENFKFKILEECNLEELDERERYWIKFYQTYPPNLEKGYNMSPGGENKGLCKVYLNLDNIIYDLKYTKISQVKIAEKYGTTNSTIYNINHGNEYYRNDISYPIRKNKFRKLSDLNTRDIEEIQDLLVNSYFSKNEIALKLNISTITIDNINKGNIAYKADLKYPLRCKENTINCCKMRLKIPMPPYEELLKNFYELEDREKVAQKYGVSSNLVRKWCNNYGFRPQRKSEYIEKYEVEFLGKEPKKKIKIQVYQIDPITNEIINIFNSKADAAEYLGLRRRIIDSITRAIKTKSLYKGYYWKEEVKILNQNK